jgi:hypothetical protein
MLCCTFSNATYAICVNVIGRSSRTWKMSTSHLVFLGRAWEMPRDFNSQEKSVSPVLETRADINAFRRTHWHHRSDGNEVTGLRNTTSCTQCSIVLRFNFWQESDFRNDVIEIDSIVTVLLPILSVRAKDFWSRKCCGRVARGQHWDTSIPPPLAYHHRRLSLRTRFQSTTAGGTPRTISFSRVSNFLSPISFNGPIMEVMVVKLLTRLQTLNCRPSFYEFGHGINM